MRYVIDHDLHIHTHLSPCSKDPTQTPERILAYAVEHGLKQICVTDHYWDAAAPNVTQHYGGLGYERISQALPLPQAEGVEFLFGCESDIDPAHNIGVPPSRYGDFGFIIIPTTHLHMMAPDCSNFDPDYRAGIWVEYFDAVLQADLPFHKVGIAHLATPLINGSSRENYIKTLDRIPDTEIYRLMQRAASLGVGIEINEDDMRFSESEADSVLRIFRIAKACGCKFYLGSDAHWSRHLGVAFPQWEKAITMLDLTEEDKFHIG